MKKIILLLAVCFMAVSTFAQFEAEKIDAGNFENVKVNVGGDFALQLQALNQSLM
jgi:cytochrome oxidase Cu insertion factor (SCO1/SenC/PrrC family)